MNDLQELLERHSYSSEQIEVFCNEVKGFTADAYEFRAVRMPDATFELQARLTKQVPIGFRVKAGTLINELRTMLDALAFKLAERNGHKKSDTVYFPISKSEAIFQDDGFKKMRALSEVDRQTIADLKPYRGGDIVLWNLHELDRTRKHWGLTASDLAVGTSFLWAPRDNWRGGSRIIHGHECDLTQFQWIGRYSSLEAFFEPPFCLLYFPRWDGNAKQTVDVFLGNASALVRRIILKFSDDSTIAR